MTTVVGIVAKSLSAAQRLASAINGSNKWSVQEDLSYVGTAVPRARACLLHSNTTRTSYLCVATHASARELAAAAAAAAAGTPAANPPEAPPSAPPGGTPHTPAASTVNTPGVATPAGGSSKRSSCSGGGDGGGDTRVATDGGAKPAAGQSLPPQPPPLLPPLQAARLAHEAACNGQLLLLFLACDIVLVALEQGGAGAGAGGVEGAVPWMARLRQLQGAKRLLHKSLSAAAPGASTRRHHRRQGATGEQQPHGSAGSRRQSGPGEGEGGAPGGADDGAAAAALGAWMERPAPPVLYFVSTAPASRLAEVPEPAERDPNRLLRSLLKRCRPLPTQNATSASQQQQQRQGSAATPHDPTLLCSLHPQRLLLAVGPLCLNPDQVHGTVLHALLQGADTQPTQYAMTDSQQQGQLQALFGGQGPESGVMDYEADLLGPAFGAALGLGGGAGCGVGYGLVSDDRKHGPVAAGTVDGPARNALQWIRQEAVASAARRQRWQPTEGGGPAAAAAATPGQLTAAWRSAEPAVCSAVTAAAYHAASQPLESLPPGLATAAGARAAAAATAAGSRDRRHGHAPPSTAPEAAEAEGRVGAAAGVTSAAQWLAAGCGLAGRMAAELAAAAAEAALKEYQTRAPPLYPPRVHRAAVAAAAAAFAAAAPLGPAAAAAEAKLRAECQEAWRAGRRQCAALSLTGRPCGRAVHGPDEPHQGPSCWPLATTTGARRVLLHDPFDLQAANAGPGLDDGVTVGVPYTAPPPPSAAAAVAAANPRRIPAAVAAAAPAADASQPSAGEGPQPQGQALPPHTRQLLVAVAQGADGTTSNAVLGPWVTVTRLGPAASYDERRGLTGQPGLDGCHLYPLTLQLGGEKLSTGGGGGGGGGGRRGGGGGGGGERNQGGRKANRTLAIAVAAAAAAVGSGPDSDGAAGEGVVLDDQSFPSLAEAVAQSGRAGAAPLPPVGAGRRKGKGQQQQQKEGTGAGGNEGQEGAGGSGGGGAGAVDERTALAAAWPVQLGAVGAPGGTGGGVGTRGAAGGLADGGAGPGAGTGAQRGRRGRGGGGGAGGGVGAGAGDKGGSGSNPQDVRKVYIAYEYETLDGRRFIPTPQQLGAAGAVPAAATAAAAAAGASKATAATASASANTPAQQQQQQQQGKQRTSQNRPPRPTDMTPGAQQSQTSASTAGGGSGGNTAASFLLQHDVPLFLPAPSAAAAAAARDVANDNGDVPPGRDAAPTWDPTPRRPPSLAALRRLFVVTPPSASGEPLLAARPTVQFRLGPTAAAAPVAALPEDALEALVSEHHEQQRRRQDAEPGQSSSVEEGEGAGGGGAGNGGGAAASEASAWRRREPPARLVQCSLARPVPLPPDSLVVVSLPWVYGLPSAWVGLEEGAGSGAGGGGGGQVEDGGEVGEGGGVEAEEGEGQGEAEGQGGAKAGEKGAAGGGGDQGRLRAQVPLGSLLVPLVPLDERMPYDAKLLAGSALFPLPPAAAQG